jgi:hypothetical protein
MGQVKSDAASAATDKARRIIRHKAKFETKVETKYETNRKAKPKEKSGRHLMPGCSLKLADTLIKSH